PLPRFACCRRQTDDLTRANATGPRPLRPGPGTDLRLRRSSPGGPPPLRDLPGPEVLSHRRTLRGVPRAVLGSVRRPDIRCSFRELTIELGTPAHQIPRKLREPLGHLAAFEVQ